MASGQENQQNTKVDNLNQNEDKLDMISYTNKANANSQIGNVQSQDNIIRSKIEEESKMIKLELDIQNQKNISGKHIAQYPVKHHIHNTHASQSQQQSSRQDEDQFRIITHQSGISKGGNLDKKKSMVNYVKSRDELLEFESEYYENLRQKVIIKRRTKIIATLNSNNYKTYEEVKQLYLAGVSSFLINMAYCEPSFLVSLNQWRNQIEAEFQVHIPLTCVLKGSLVRIGMLSQPETYLRKGQEYRILIQKKIVGDSNICSVDDDNLVKRLGIGAKLIIDYGQVGLTVIGKEKSDTALKYLQDNFNYGKYFIRSMSERRRRTDSYINSCCSSSDLDTNQISQSLSSSQIDQLGTANDKLDLKLTQSNSKEEIPADIPAGIKNIFAEELAVQKLRRPKKLYDVIICRVDSDCMLKSYKPIFIYKNRDERESLFYSKKTKQLGKTTQQQSFAKEQLPNGQEEEDEEECDEEELYDQVGENVLNAKDITDINNALNHDFDSICVSNVRTAQDILAVRKYCETSKSAKIIAKIQTLEGVHNFQEILSVSDSVLIARGYLTVQIPVEKLHFKQNELIALANESLKPVLVSCNILDSMVSSLLPTTCEVGEISNLVTQYVDSIILSGETSYGMHPIQAVETLSRICMETEARQIILHNTIDSSLLYRLHWTKSSIINTIVQCTLSAAYNIAANLIVVFTSTGNTALKISKLRPPCPIIAVTANNKLARHLNYLSATSGIVYPSLVGTSILLEKVLAYAKEYKYVKHGDLVIVTSGEIENLSGTTNNLKIIKVSNEEAQ